MGIEQLLEKASTYMKEQDLQTNHGKHTNSPRKPIAAKCANQGSLIFCIPLPSLKFWSTCRWMSTSVIAALLHDVVEDTTVSLDDGRGAVRQDMRHAGRRFNQAGENSVQDRKKNNRTRITAKCSSPWRRIFASS